MSDSPKFEIVDRRKMKAEEEQQTAHQRDEAAHEKAGETAAPAQTTSRPAEAASGPRLVETAPARESKPAPQPDAASEAEQAGDLAAAPTAQESQQQKAAYDASAERVEDLIRAQNPGMGAQPPVTFEHLIQQFYVSALLQMGAGTQEGQRPQVDILGARNTIDLLGILAEKTRGNLSRQEDSMLQTVLFELRMTFLELTKMIGMPSVQPPAPKKR